MGFVSQVLGEIQEIRYFYIVGIFIFLGLFINILIRTLRMPKQELESIKTSILDNDDVIENA